MLVDIIAIHPRKLLQNASLMLPLHFLLIVALLHLAIYLSMQLLFHLLRHVLVILEFRQPIQIIVFLVKLKRVKTLFSLLLHVDVLGGLFLGNLLLSCFELIINRLKHILLLLRLLLFLLLWVLLEQVFRNSQQLSQMSIFRL